MRKRAEEHLVCPSCGGTGLTGEPGSGARCARCGASIRTGKTVIEVQGTDADEVQRVASTLAAEEASRRTALEELEARNRAAKTLAGPWNSGLFYLLAAVVLVGIVLAVGTLVPLWAIPVVLICAIVLLAVVGALQLRQDERLSEKGFLALMRLALSQAKAIARSGSPQK